MHRELSLFVGTFTTLLAIINPLEVLPVYLQLLVGKDVATHRAVARNSCFYALMLCFFFLVFGTLMLRIFGVPLAMVRVVGGIILMRIGFELFTPPKDGAFSAGAAAPDANIAFVPLAMPLMFGPGAIATIIGMTATIRQSSEELLSFVAIAAAIVLTMAVTYLCLALRPMRPSPMRPVGRPSCAGRLRPGGVDGGRRDAGVGVHGRAALRRGGPPQGTPGDHPLVGDAYCCRTSARSLSRNG